MDYSDCIPPGSGQFPDRVFAFCDASANHGQSEKLILPLGPQAAIFPIDYPRILLQTPNFELRTMRPGSDLIESLV